MNTREQLNHYLSVLEKRLRWMAISKGIDRDRAVDESGNQLAVFNRRGSRPFQKKEMEKMYLTPEGKLYTVTDAPPRPGTAKYDEMMKEQEHKRLEPKVKDDAATANPATSWSGLGAVH